MWSFISSTLRKLAVALAWLGMLVLACRGEPDENEGATEFRGGEPPPGLENEVNSLRAAGVTINASSEVGTIPGVGSVGPTGQAAYSIAIDVPPGAGGLAPSLALQYGSGGGNGSFGLGWGLVGLSSIDRCAKTIADDEAFAPVEFDGSGSTPKTSGSIQATRCTDKRSETASRTSSGDMMRCAKARLIRRAAEARTTCSIDRGMTSCSQNRTATLSP